MRANWWKLRSLASRRGQCCAGIFAGPDKSCIARAGAHPSVTLGRLRREIEPVTTVDFLAFLSRWQHVAKAAVARRWTGCCSDPDCRV